MGIYMRFEKHMRAHMRAENWHMRFLSAHVTFELQRRIWGVGG